MSHKKGLIWVNTNNPNYKNKHKVACQLLLTDLKTGVHVWSSNETMSSVEEERVDCPPV